MHKHVATSNHIITRKYIFENTIV